VLTADTCHSSLQIARTHRARLRDRDTRCLMELVGRAQASDNFILLSASVGVPPQITKADSSSRVISSSALHLVDSVTANSAYYLLPHESTPLKRWRSRELKRHYSASATSDTSFTFMHWPSFAFARSNRRNFKQIRVNGQPSGQSTALLPPLRRSMTR